MVHFNFKLRKTGQIISREELLKLYSNTSFPVDPWPTSVYDFIEADPVISTLSPDEDEYNIPVEDGYIQRADGAWIQQWKLVSKFKTQEELDAYNEITLKEKWEAVRASRDTYIAKTDYTQLPDTPITDECRAAFANYRTALRNITSQPDPFNIVWPEVPIYVKK